MKHYRSVINIDSVNTESAQRPPKAPRKRPKVERRSLEEMGRVAAFLEQIERESNPAPAESAPDVQKNGHGEHRTKEDASNGLGD